MVRADAELTLAFRTGDEDAVRELCRRYGGLVFTVEADGPGAGDRADPAVHTFLQAWRNSEAFEPGRSFGEWLGSLACRLRRGGGASEPGDADLVDRLLADPATWKSPPDDLADRVVAAVLSEATVDPSHLYTADDLRAAQAAASSSRSFRTVAPGAAGAGFVLVVGVLILSAIGGSGDTGSRTIELRPTGRVLDVSGSIEVESVPAGLQIVVEAPSLPDPGAGQWYEARVVLDDGSTVTAGTFTEGSDVALTAAVSGADSDQFVIVLTGSGSDGTFSERDVVLRAPLP
jgi:hypothetical protein